MAEDWRAVAEEALARLGEAAELGRVEQRQDCAEQLRTWASVLERGNIYSVPATALFADGLRVIANAWSPRTPDA